MPDSKKVQFIICATDQRELEECRFYISKLQLPQGIQIDVTEVFGAESMTEGYNAGMCRSDAKYRIYLHQDTCIIYSRMLYDLLHIFETHSNIGMLGVVGARELPLTEIPHKAWDLGRVDTNTSPFELNYQKEAPKKGYEKAQAVDGLLIATQQDIPWREDLFRKWDFYDISQALEMQRKGYEVVVPFQEQAWCWHDNETSKLADYEGERQIFAEEYQDIKAFETGELYPFSKEQDELLEEFQAETLRMIDWDGIRAVEGLLEQYHGLLGSKEKLLLLENICYIRKIERSAGRKEGGLYGEHLSSDELLCMLREDKFAVKRIEYGYGKEAENFIVRFRRGEISKEAVFGLAVCYVKNRKKVMLDFERLTEM